MGGFTTAIEGNWRSDNSPAVTDPILTQPGLGVTTTTITTITQTGGDWSTGLFDICGDKTTCNMNTQGSHAPITTLRLLFYSLCSCYVNFVHTHIYKLWWPVSVLAGILGALVPCCLDLSLAHQYGECLCMPLLPGSTFAIRVGIRERYKIQVSVCIHMWKTYLSMGSKDLCCLLKHPLTHQQADFKKWFLLTPA